MLQSGKCYKSDGTIISTWAAPKPLFVSDASIDDVIGNKKGWNPCYNRRVLTRTIPGSIESARHPTLDCHYQSSQIYMEPAWVSVQPEVDWCSAYAQLLDDASGIMPRDTSALVNLAELGSLKTLVPSLFRGIGGFFSKSARVLKGKTYRDLAGSHLAVEFGLLPLIGDFGKFMNLRKRVAAKMKIQKYRAFRNVEIRAKTPVWTGSTEATFPNVRWGRDYEESNRVAKCNTTALGVVAATAYTVPLDDPSAEFRLWVGALGLNNPIGVAWELIPFSFVCDWFLPIGQKINQLALPRNLGTTVRSVELSNFRYSLKCETNRTFSAESTSFPGSTWQISASQPGGFDQLERTYVRSYGRMDEGFTWSSSAWSVRKTALSVSLIAQKALK